MRELIKTYIQELKEYDSYEHTVSDTAYFSYENRHSEGYKKIREKFITEDLIKDKSIFEKTIRLMDFVHKELFFAGENIYPNRKNTLDIMNLRKKGALSCWYHSIVLSEMLASVGILSRVISCLPGKFDQDSHMGVMVFDTARLRWFFVDPTFNTYFHSESGEPLDVFQVRNQYKIGKLPLFKHINIDKKWSLVCNGVICETYDEWYTLYMAKNTFRFMSPSRSYFDCLSDKELDWIVINPLNYIHQDQYDTDKNIIFIHSINDFLQAPNQTN